MSGVDDRVTSANIFGTMPTVDSQVPHLTMRRERRFAKVAIARKPAFLACDSEWVGGDNRWHFRHTRCGWCGLRR